MVRAVNTGISAFIDANGRIRQPEHFFVMEDNGAAIQPTFEKVDSMIDPETGRRYRQCSAVMCGQIPLDGRSTFYLQFGDWFAMLCTGVTIVGLLKERFFRTAEVTVTSPKSEVAASTLNAAA